MVKNSKDPNFELNKLAIKKTYSKLISIQKPFNLDAPTWNQPRGKKSSIELLARAKEKQKLIIMR
jgi:hypothetical protein